MFRGIQVAVGDGDHQYLFLHKGVSVWHLSFWAVPVAGDPLMPPGAKKLSLCIWYSSIWNGSVAGICSLVHKGLHVHVDTFMLF